jgi:hypothetical protein
MVVNVEGKNILSACSEKPMVVPLYVVWLTQIEKQFFTRPFKAMRERITISD